MGIVIAVFVLIWCWCIWEAMNAPIMPDDYDMNDMEKEVWKELERECSDDLPMMGRKQSHGLLGGNLQDTHMRGKNEN
tara:strand:- start:145 stop:378 length:234 start_codon:yes stop_codon:yes gene_type:complete